MATMSITRRFNNLSNHFIFSSHQKTSLLPMANIRGSMMGAVDDLWITGSTEHKTPLSLFE